MGRFQTWTKDQENLNQLIHISQSKLSLELDADMSRCLRKAVLVQNTLRRSTSVNALVPSIPSDNGVEEDVEQQTMEIDHSSPRRSNRPLGKRLMSFDGEHEQQQPYQGWSMSMNDCDNDDAHVPDMLDQPRHVSHSFGQGFSAARLASDDSLMMVDCDNHGLSEVQANSMLEVSPPPSPDTLNCDVDGEMDNIDYMYQPATNNKRKAVASLYKSSPSSVDDSLEFESSKRPRVLHDSPASVLFGIVH